MRKIAVPRRDQVSANNQDLFDNLTKTLGSVPNLYAVMAYSKTALSKYLTFQNTITSLSNKEREAINLTVSQVNHCVYCLSAHTMIARMNDFPDEEILALRRGRSSDPKLNALVRLAQAIVLEKGNVPQETIDHFFEKGYSAEQLIDLIMQVGDKIISNYLHNLTGVPVDFPLAPELNDTTFINH
jgi:uncharacterized peroxidase-related enzyme